MIESKGQMWDEVSWNKGKELTERIPVPGGWIYRTIAYGYSGTVSVALTFVPAVPVRQPDLYRGKPVESGTFLGTPPEGFVP